MQSKPRANFLIASTVLDAISALCMVFLSYFEHSRAPRPSTLLSLYLAVKTLLDIAQTRTLWLASQSSHDVAFSRVFTAATAISGVMIVLESVRKRRWARWDTSDRSPEETLGPFELATSTWIFCLLQNGRRKILVMEDLHALDHRISAEVLHSHVVNLRVSEFRGKKNALLMALIRTLAVPLLMPVIPYLIQVTLSLCQPLLVQSLLNYLKDPPANPRNNGYGIIGAAVILYLASPLAWSMAQYYESRSLFMMRSTLVDAVYRKTTRAQSTTSDDAKALTLMGADVERIRFGLTGMHELWWVPLQVGVSCWLLYRQLGAAFAAPIVLITCLSVSTAVVMQWVRPLQITWMERIETRVGKTTNVIANMKNIKISGLSRPVEESIQAMRVAEIKAANKCRAVRLAITTAGFAPGALSAMFTFAVTAKHLDVTTIFTSIALLELLAGPLNNFFQSIPNMLAAFTCIQRVQDFLELEEKKDFRQFCSMEKTDEISTSQDGFQIPVIEMLGGSFGWEADRMVLKNIDASFFPGLNIVVGPVASGKTTLCKVLLGETPFAQGKVSYSLSPEKIAFCDQVPFLFNATIKENVVGFGAVDEDRYNRAIQATMLNPDIEIFPQGDQTKVGSNGITLSGGQRQRVSIARAIYHECELYIFDDILSGLDNDTEKHVFTHVFGSSGILRERNATVILCTHAVHYLSRASHIIALSPDGTMVEQGSFDELMRNEQYVHSLGVSEKESKDDAGNVAAPHDPMPNNPVTTKSVKGKPEELAKEESRSSGDFSVFIHYFKSAGAVRGGIFLFSGVLCGFFWNFPNAWLAIWTTDASSGHSQHPNPFYLGVYSLLSCLKLSATITSIGFGYFLVARISGLSLHKAAIRTIIAAPLRFFVKTDVGIVTNLFSQDMSLIDDELPLSLINTVAMFWMVVGSAALAATSSVYLLISYPFLIFVAYFLQRFYLFTSRQLRLLDLETKSPLYTHFIDTMKGLVTFRAFGWTEESIIKNNAFINASTNPAYQLSMIQRWLTCTLRYLMAIIAICVVSLSTQLKASSGFTGASMVSLISFPGYLAALIGNYTLLETSLGAVNRLREFGRKTEQEDLPGEDVVPEVSWPEKGRIEVSGLSASYDYSPSSSSSGDFSEKHEDMTVQALRNLNLTIEAGQKVAICGRTGSGKSSFILMLLRLLDPLPSSDLVLSIDGVSLAEIDRETLRQRLIAVPQEPVFLPNGTSFKLNLDPGHVATDAECQASLEAVDLWNFVNDRGGLHGSLSADFFSLGQKQLFSLGRAILRRRVRLRQRGLNTETHTTAAVSSPSDTATQAALVPDGGVLILDEYSSGLDHATDKLMQQIIHAEFQGYTIVMVSHRLEMVMDFDKVVVLHTGQIVEDGVPKELVEQNGSRFRGLWLTRNSE